ncbi:MAG: ImmA/IrrE family metallo-endopeptidase [Magnetococcales bacterium]|nr:ImmA/IrrE family metallo-endopeptidase [Magnetococcales bacterium]
MDEIVRHLGGQIVSVGRENKMSESGPVDSESSGLSYIVVGKGDKKFEIGLDKDLGPEQKRFDTAHELGHYLVNYPIVKKSGHDTMKAQGVGLGRADWEAQWFALSFLLPVDQLVKECQNLDFDLNTLCDNEEFSVPKEILASLVDIFKVEAFYVTARLKEIIKWPGLIQKTSVREVSPTSTET